jgi:prolipoprotein diacylglyceryltransferase
VERFLIEILRAKDDRFLGPFTLAQLTSAVLVAVGAYILTLWRDDPEPDPGDYLRGDKEPVPSKTSTGKEPLGNKGVAGAK